MTDAFNEFYNDLDKGDDEGSADRRRDVHDRRRVVPSGGDEDVIGDAYEDMMNEDVAPALPRERRPSKRTSEVVLPNDDRFLRPPPPPPTTTTTTTTTTTRRDHRVGVPVRDHRFDDEDVVATRDHQYAEDDDEPTHQQHCWSAPESRARRADDRCDDRPDHDDDDDDDDAAFRNVTVLVEEDRTTNIVRDFYNVDNVDFDDESAVETERAERSVVAPTPRDARRGSDDDEEDDDRYRRPTRRRDDPSYSSASSGRRDDGDRSRRTASSYRDDPSSISSTTRREEYEYDEYDEYEYAADSDPPSLDRRPVPPRGGRFSVPAGLSATLGRVVSKVATKIKTTRNDVETRRLRRNDEEGDDDDEDERCSESGSSSRRSLRREVDDDNDYDYDETTLSKAISVASSFGRNKGKLRTRLMVSAVFFLLGLIVVFAITHKKQSRPAPVNEIVPTSPPTSCWNWHLLHDEINGLDDDERVGSTVSLSSRGDVLAVAGIDLARTYRERTDNTYGWRVTAGNVLGSDVEDVSRPPLLDANGEIVRTASVVALSADGATLVVAEPYAAAARGGQSVGRVVVLRWSEGGRGGEAAAWARLGPVLYGTLFDDLLGVGAAIDGDGTRVVVGSQLSVRVYDLKETVRFDVDPDADDDASRSDVEHDWILNRQILKAYYEGVFGKAVAISADGARIAVGEPEIDDDRGAVSVYDVDPTYRLVIRIDGGFTDDRFGKSVSLSADGNVLAVGAYWGDYAQVFRYLAEADGWTHLGYKIRSAHATDFENDDAEDGNEYSYYYADSEEDAFGRSVSLSADGRRLAISAPSDDDAVAGRNHTGRTRVYDYVEERKDWVQIGTDIYGENDYDYSGWSISLSGDGKRLAVGADWNSDAYYKGGHVRVYEYVCR